MARVRANFFEGTLSSQLLSGATTLMSAALATFPEVTAPDVAYLVIGNTADTKEIVKVTAHSVSATTATIVRGQDSTTDRTWAAGVAVKQAMIGSEIDLAATTATTEQGIHVNDTSPDYGKWYTIGNAGNSMGFAGTPPGDEDAWASLVVYRHFGDKDGLTNANVEHTTQSIAVLASYWGPTVDDSAQASSFFVALKDTGTGFTQSKPLTAVEAHAQVEGDNDLTGGTSEATAYGARLTLGTGTITTATMFSASGATSSGTITNWYAFRQKATPGGTVTNKFGLYVIDPAICETQIALQASGVTAGVSMKIAGSGGGSPTLVDIAMPNVTGGETDLSGLKIRQGSGGLKNMQEWWVSGGSGAALAVTRFGGLTTTNTNIQINNSGGTAMIGMRPDGFYWHSSTLEQTTVGAAGAASALPATPTKYLKIKDSAGTTLVVPAYAAS